MRIMFLPLALLSVFLGACTPAYYDKERLYPPLTELELYRQGGDIFCDEPEFLECLGMSRAECDAETRLHVHGCITAVKAELGAIEGKEGSGHLVRGYSQCLAERILEPAGREEAERCLDSTL